MLIDRRELLGIAATAALAPVFSRSARASENPLQDNRVFELRQYTLREHQRDELIALFEQQFIEPQEILGAHVVGMFRDLNAACLRLAPDQLADLLLRELVRAGAVSVQDGFMVPM